jgi:hypothetical protein
MDLKTGDEKCFSNPVVNKKSGEKCFGVQADLKRVVNISATTWLMKRGNSRIVWQPGGPQRR